MVAPTSTELDLRDDEAVRVAVADTSPAAIVHTAYRRDERASMVDASRHVARSAAEHGCRLVHVSTDALFAGRAAPYTEHDDPTPVHDYGRAKADAEADVAAACPDAAIVRTSLIYGNAEPSMHEAAVADAIAGRSDTAFFTDEVRSPVLVDDLAAALLELTDRDDIGGILHLGGPDALTRAELALLAARRHGWDADRLRFSTIVESGLARPGRVVLDSTAARSLGIVVGGPGRWA